MTHVEKFFSRLADAIRTPRLRTMREFAEAEIIIPTGPFAGLRYSCARQPYSRLWFDEVDSGRWRRFVATGPTQSGKTLQALVIPVLYHLFEVGEDVIFAAPTMDIARDKWLRDILPVIKSSRYKDLLPRSGAGSKGGKAELVLIEFRNGRVLRVMTGGGDDKSRSNFTSRVVAITETDGLDESSETSREADKISQLEARTTAFDDRARIYMECTVSTEEGRTWQEYSKGSESRIAIRCPHCRGYVTPERENLVGWQSAEDEIAAGESGHVCCPSCGAQWTEEERIAANHDCRLVHRGMEIAPDGTLTAQPPRADTLGFRWNAVNNLLVKTKELAKKEWSGARATNEENSEKNLNQFTWAKPYKSPTLNLTELDPQIIVKRTTQDPRGRVPDGVARLTLGIDVGLYLAHWTLLGWRPNASPHVVEYGRIEIPTKELGEEKAIAAGLRGFRDTVIAQGWPSASGMMRPELTGVDAGWNQEIVLGFCAEEAGFLAVKGFGVKSLGNNRKVGEKTEAGWVLGWAPPDSGYELLQHQGTKRRMLDVKVDRWKSWLHARIQTPMDKPGAITLHQQTQPNEHVGFAKHLTAEKKQEEFEAGKGVVIRWVQMHRNNHWLDSSVIACVIAHALGERLMGESPAPAAESSKPAESGSNPMNYRGKW